MLLYLTSNTRIWLLLFLLLFLLLAVLPDKVCILRYLYFIMVKNIN